MTAIKIENLVKKYKDITAVNGVSLQIEEGELLALLGENGAGKTTVIKVLTGLTELTSGSAVILGYDIIKERQKIKPLINLSPQETAVAPNLTAIQNLMLVARLYGIDKVNAKKEALRLLAELDLLEVKNKIAKKLSGGMMRRLSIAMALISNPKVLFLDEPTLGLDVRARRELWSIIEGLKGKVTIILTTHYLEEAQALADKIAIMNVGKIKTVGTLEQLKIQSNKDNIEDIFLHFTGDLS